MERVEPLLPARRGGVRGEPAGAARLPAAVAWLGDAGGAGAASGLVAAGRAGGRSGADAAVGSWLAQAAPERAGRTTTARSPWLEVERRRRRRRGRCARAAGARAAPVCHDFKSAAALHGAAWTRPATTPTWPPTCWRRGAGTTGWTTWRARPGCLPVPSRRRRWRRRRGRRRAGGRAGARRWPRAQERELRDQGMWELFQDIELPLTRVLIAMEQAGIHLDCYRLGEITGKIQDQMEELEACIYELAGEEFNLGSPQQLGRILFERLGLPRQRKIKTGYSTDAKTLEALRDSHPDRRAPRSTTGSSPSSCPPICWPCPQVVDPAPAGCTPPSTRPWPPPAGSRPAIPTCRTSRSAPRWARRSGECFTAEPGNLLVVADYSQIELRIMAHLSREPALLEAFRRARTSTAAPRPRCSAWPRTRWTPTHRRYAKAVNFGIMYGISAFGLSQNLGIDREEAAAYIERYFERLPRVKAFIEATIDDRPPPGLRGHRVRPAAAHPRAGLGQLPGRARLGERLAVNSVIQGSAADIIKVAMIRCHERLAREFPGRPAGAAGARRTGVRGARRTRPTPCATPWWRRWWAPSHGPAAGGGRGDRARLAVGEVGGARRAHAR